MHPMYQDLPRLCADLDTEITQLAQIATRDPASWEKGPPKKWTMGQQVAHVGISLARTADLFEQSERALRAGTLAPAPGRGLLERLFFRVCVTGGTMPRGAKTAPWALPAEHPDRETTTSSLARDSGRHRALEERLQPGERWGLWIQSPFVTTWHYRLPEMVRMHAVHARHHRRQIEEALRA